MAFSPVDISFGQEMSPCKFILERKGTSSCSGTMWIEILQWSSLTVVNSPWVLPKFCCFIVVNGNLRTNFTLIASTLLLIKLCGRMLFPFHPSTGLNWVKTAEWKFDLEYPPHFWWDLAEHVACPVVSSAGLLCGRIEVGFCLRAELIDRFYSLLEGRVLSGRKTSKKLFVDVELCWGTCGRVWDYCTLGQFNICFVQLMVY